MTHPLAEDLEGILDRTRDLWSELRGTRIFLTGATGFFGRWLLESFLWADERLSLGAELVALSRAPNAFLSRAPDLSRRPSLHFHRGDQVDFDFPEGHFDAVIHAAVDYADPLATFERNLCGTRRVLQFASAAGARQVLFTSSGAIYGPQPRQLERLDEEQTGSPDLADPVSAYGLAKRAGEHLGHLHPELEFKIARCFAFVGPYMPWDRNGAMGNFIADALRGSPIRVSGDGTPLRSYLYAADLAAWLWTILLKGAPGRAYNVGGEEAVSIRELAKRVAAVLAPGTEPQVALVPQEGSPARYLPNLDRARRELRLEAWTPLDEAIRRTGLHHSRKQEA